MGATANQPPAGYVLDHTREALGTGEQVFAAAKQALCAWRQFQLPWLESTGGALQIGTVVGILAHTAGWWWSNACRIVYVIDEQDSITRFGFAYGTLPDHVGSGEERFLIEWDHHDDRVWYDVLAFSRPQHLLARAGYPLVRRIQKRFGREYSAAMRIAVGEPMAR